MTRWDVIDDPKGAVESLNTRIKAQPSGAQDRRQRPFFKITDQEMKGLAEFLGWADQTGTQNWPPNDAG